MSEIFVFPEYKELVTEVNKLRTELSILFLEQDELRLVICKNIEMKYMLVLGAAEYRAFKAQCEFLRLRRKSELIQAKLNRQEAIDIKTIDNLLDTEFEQFQQKLDEQIGKMNDAIDRSSSTVLSQSEAQEIKKLYRKIVKSLHPDIDPNSTQARCDLFVRAVEAYENGDLQTIMVIAEMVANDSTAEQHEDILAQLYKERERLAKLMEKVKSNISAIKSEYPYILKELVEDEKKIAERNSELENMIAQYEVLIAEYKLRIENMMR